MSKMSGKKTARRKARKAKRNSKMSDKKGTVMEPLERWFNFLDEHPDYVVKCEPIENGVTCDPLKMRFTATHVRDPKNPCVARGEVIALDFNVFPDPAEMVHGVHGAILDTGRTLVRDEGCVTYVPWAMSRRAA